MDWVKILGLLCILLPTFASSFQVLPYVHIDYEHYYRLAQCQAQCSEKYGTVGYRRRLDGSTRSFFNVSGHFCQMCHLGCANFRAPNAKRINAQRSVGDAFKDGQTFWANAALATPIPPKRAPTSTSDRSPLSALRVLCLRPASTVPENGGYLDSYEALLSALPHKHDFLAPVKFLVQWKQRIPMAKEGQFDETKWITAAIENDWTLTVEGIQPGVQYRFMVTVIGANGRMGSGVTSEWIEGPALGSPMPLIALPLTISPQFNTDDNVSAIVSFRRHSETASAPTAAALSASPLPTVPTSTVAVHSRRSIPPTCSYHLRFSNNTPDVNTVDFEMDESEGILLTNLAFNTNYDVQLLPRVLSPTTAAAVDPTTAGVTSAVGGRFRTMSCSDVFGPGSLQCDPEPVRDLDIQMNDENGTVILSWTPTTESRHVLLYELKYVPVSDKSECAVDESTIYLPAKATRAELSLPADTECEVEVQLTNFDLRGREALLTARFLYRPRQQPSDGFFATLQSKLSTHLWLLVVAPVVVVVALLIVLLRFAALGQKRLKKVVAKNNRAVPV